MSDPRPSQQLNRYQQIIARVFLSRYQPGNREVAFDREDLVRAAQQLGVEALLGAAMPSSISRSERCASWKPAREKTLIAASRI